jgi:hypothetical protein
MGPEKTGGFRRGILEESPLPEDEKLNPKKFDLEAENKKREGGRVVEPSRPQNALFSGQLAREGPAGALHR